MRYFARFSPLHAIRDLRVFLSHRHPYELGFLALAMVITTALIAGFVHDSHAERPYVRNIIYVEQWPATRTEAEILARQKIDQVGERARKAEIVRQQKAVQADFKKLDDRLKAMGL
ncbi:MAG: hypothetical protein B7Y47_05395 [Sphingomonas sp. 28-63-12]|nr:MAG: hypothetical protein B7Y47_05395 [Sphingomonas sp. 28-63-12]